MELRAKHKAAFGFGAFGKDVVYILIANYLLYYYNAVLGMDSVFIGAMMMAARVFDAFNDPLMGIVVAKTKTRWGRFRPWILAGTVLNALTIYALYATPATVTGNTQKIWLTGFYLAWGVTYTLMDIPFWSMIPAITKPGKDRESMSSLARACAGLGDAVPYVATMMIVPILAHSNKPSGYAPGFKIWALMIAVLFVVAELVCVLVVPEPKVDTEMESPGVIQMFKSLFKNDQALTIVFSVILVYTALNIVGNLVLYFFQFDVRNVGAYSAFTAACFATQVVIMALIPAIRKVLTKSQTFVAGFVLQIIGFVAILIMAVTGFYHHAGGWVWFLLPGMLVYAGYGMLNVLLTVFLSDSVDYGEYKNGTRDESVIFSMQTFTVKLASGLAVFIAGVVIKMIALDTTATVQSASTLMGLRLWLTVPSTILLIIGIIVYKKFYKLDDEMMAKIMKKIGR